MVVNSRRQINQVSILETGIEGSFNSKQHHQQAGGVGGTPVSLMTLSCHQHLPLVKSSLLLCQICQKSGSPEAWMHA